MRGNENVLVVYVHCTRLKILHFEMVIMNTIKEMFVFKLPVINHDTDDLI